MRLFIYCLFFVSISRGWMLLHASLDSCAVDSLSSPLVPRLSMRRDQNFLDRDERLLPQPSIAHSRARIIIHPDDQAERFLEDVHEEENVVLDHESDLFDDWFHRYQPSSAREPLRLSLPQREMWSTVENLPSNELLSKLPKLQRKKTGTTIVGILVEGTDNTGDNHNATSFVVLAADTRATAGRLVADKRADKIHCLFRSDSAAAFACGAGTSADLDKVTKQCYYTMQLRTKELESIGLDYYLSGEDSGRKLFLPVVEFNAICQFLQDTLYQQGGRCGANLIVGGASRGQCYLRAIHPHGSMDRLDSFSALGSGGLAAMAVLEQYYRRALSRHEAIALAKRAIMAGIENDLGSGSQVDICVIDSNGSVEHIRGAVPELELGPVPTATARGPAPRELVLSGVNGFGSFPFIVRQQEEIHIDPERNAGFWDQVLGI